MTAVERKSPADEAGLLTGDIILSVDNHRVTGADDLVRLLDAERIDRVVAVDVLRRSDMRRFWVGLKERVSLIAKRCAQYLFGPLPQGSVKFLKQLKGVP